MVGENRRLVHYQPMDFPSWPVAGPNFQSSDDNPTVIPILRQLADGPENVPEM
jgi:hypothetical protein